MNNVRADYLQSASVIRTHRSSERRLEGRQSVLLRLEHLRTVYTQEVAPAVLQTAIRKTTQEISALTPAASICRQARVRMRVIERSHFQDAGVARTVPENVRRLCGLRDAAEKLVVDIECTLKDQLRIVECTEPKKYHITGR